MAKLFFRPASTAHVFRIMCVFFFGITLLNVAGVERVHAAEPISCACPEPSCGPCEEETGVDFYTEKCGPGLSKVKSCKRRQCTKVQDHDMCMAKLKGASVVPVVAKADVDPRSAEVVLAMGQVHVKRAKSNLEEKLEKKMVVFKGDRIVTGNDGRARLRFQELSEIFVSPSSTLVVADATVEKKNIGNAKRTILLELVNGRVRSRVQGRYNDDSQSRFEVKTPAAVAGVRGTDFTVAFDSGSASASGPAQWKTEVYTSQGEVNLSGLIAGPNGRVQASVVAGNYVAYVVPAPADGASAFEVEAALSRGFMTPVFKMSTEDLQKLDLETKEPEAPKGAATDAAGRAVASASSSLCHAPSAAFNQCSWTCEGNPKGASGCRTDLANVRCVRRLCRASGEWAEPTVLPSKQGINCEAAKPIVGDCGGYW